VDRRFITNLNVSLLASTCLSGVNTLTKLLAKIVFQQKFTLFLPGAKIYFLWMTLLDGVFRFVFVVFITLNLTGNIKERFFIKY